MNNFWTVLSHTYISKIRSKQFIVTTLLTLALILIMANFNKIIDLFKGGEDEAKVIVVIDETNKLFTPFEQIVQTINPDLKLTSEDASEEDLKERVLNDEIFGYFILQLDENQLPKGTYKAKSLTNFSIPSDLNNALQQLKMSVAAENLQLSGEQLQILNNPAQFDEVALGSQGKSQEELSQARGLVYVLLFVIYFAVIMYANMIAMEVATEKSSRVMEILISSTPPITQMFAKIIGVAFVGLTQLALWLGVGYVAIKRNLNDMTGGFFSVFGFENTPLSTIIYAIVFFLLGFLLYATMAAFLGSLVSRIEDVSQVINPMMWLIIIGFIIAVNGLTMPDATFITVTSYIPFFTPMIMFLRVGLLDLPLWEPILSIVLMILTIGIFAVFGARVYKGGVLMYGNTGALKNIKKALQLTKSER
ncbi:ABC transporter permease [Fervidibacillus halotolerans]|uniref:ABC transporter permease n=1 Tax=Fervidibacillus halotolerans TaxID=2980027 RepID=A0A9E8RZB8_9BACI|nr:ABC transporter permease [Fervidibacillus halotolerans]WAA13004.1 ABC transporter permease [Fervidibacillus halotolerans]